MKKQTYNFVLTPSIKEALEVAARKDRRSMSSLLEKIVVDYLAKEGIPWENDISKSKPVRAGQLPKRISKK